MIQSINRPSTDSSDIITFLWKKKKTTNILLPTASLCKIALLSSHILFAIAPERSAITNKDADNKPTRTEGMPGETDLFLTYKLSKHFFEVLLEKNGSSKDEKLKNKEILCINTKHLFNTYNAMH